MTTSIKHVLILTTAVLFIGFTTAAADQPIFGWKWLFDGTTLNGWETPEMSYWSVQDGAITAESTDENPCEQNQFLTWKQGEVDDFELKFQFRIIGTDRANSGVQIRGTVNPDGHVIGYQCDMDRGIKWLGAIYDEHTTRKLLAGRGQRTYIDAQGNRTEEELKDVSTPPEDFNPEEWNIYHISAIGNKISIRINDTLISEVIDNETAERDLQGLLALQLHAGPSMKVQFKDIQIKRLPLSDGRRKIVFLAGLKSHAPRAHEHRAGCWLLSKCLNRSHADKVVASVYYDNGWPEDPTAFDNANAVIIYSDGNAKHPLVEKMDHWKQFDQDGISLGCIHYAVEVPTGPTADALRKFIGGVFETFYSVNPHWEADFAKLPKHPITRGVKPFKIMDEWYYHMRFRDGMTNVTPILFATPPDETRTAKWETHHGGNEHVKARMGMEETVMWASENKSGTRGFGFTGGHFHDNWSNDDFRKIVMNAILWVAKGDVPANGLTSTVSEKEINTNLDLKPPKKKRNKAN